MPKLPIRKRHADCRRFLAAKKSRNSSTRRGLLENASCSCLYATGARNSELTHLKVSDIDNQRMVVHIRGGKGRKDRDVMLSAKLLAALRTDWRYYHRKSSTWLFPSNFRKDRPIHTKTVWYACHQSAQRAGLQKRVHPHTLRVWWGPPMRKRPGHLIDRTREYRAGW